MGAPRWHFPFRIHQINSESYGNKIYVPVFRRLVVETDRLRSRPRFAAMALNTTAKFGKGRWGHDRQRNRNHIPGTLLRVATSQYRSLQAQFRCDSEPDE